jgi:hypothetical protein
LYLRLFPNEGCVIPFRLAVLAMVVSIAAVACGDADDGEFNALSESPTPSSASATSTPAPSETPAAPTPEPSATPKPAPPDTPKPAPTRDLSHAEPLTGFGDVLPGRTYRMSAFVFDTPPGDYRLRMLSGIGDPNPGYSLLVLVSEDEDGEINAVLRFYPTGKESGRSVHDPTYRPIFDAIMASMITNPELPHIKDGDVLPAGGVHRFQRVVFFAPAEFLVNVGVDHGGTALILTNTESGAQLAIDADTGAELRREATSEEQRRVVDTLLETLVVRD